MVSWELAFSGAGGGGMGVGVFASKDLSGDTADFISVVFAAVNFSLDGTSLGFSMGFLATRADVVLGVDFLVIFFSSAGFSVFFLCAISFGISFMAQK
jgi:hypothetical protein